MQVTVDDILVSRGLVPIKFSTFLASLMWGSPVGGCSVLTARRSRLVAATQKVRAVFSRQEEKPNGQPPTCWNNFKQVYV